MFYFSAVFLIGALCTQFIQAYVLNPVLASSFFMSLFCISILGIGSYHKLAMPMLSGSLAGMMSINLSASGLLESQMAEVDWSIFIFSCIIALFYMVIYLIDTKGPWQLGKGFGGRMGTIGFLTCIGFYFIVHEPDFPLGVGLERFSDSLKFIIYSAVFSLLGCGMTLVFRRLFLLQLPDLHIPLSASLSALLFAVPVYFDFYGIYLSAAAYSGALLAMTETHILEDWKILGFLALLNGVTLWALGYVFLGFGGLLGLSALCTLVVYFCLKRIINWTRA